MKCYDTIKSVSPVISSHKVTINVEVTATMWVKMVMVSILIRLHQIDMSLSYYGFTITTIVVGQMCLSCSNMWYTVLKTPTLKGDALTTNVSLLTTDQK